MRLKKMAAKCMVRRLQLDHLFADEYTVKVLGGLAFSDFRGQSKTEAFTIPKGASRSHSH